MATTSTPDLAALFAHGEGKVRDAEITQVLCDRLDVSAPYTWASPTMLVATNPYFDTSQMDQEAAEAASVHAHVPSLQPHPYSLAARVYHKMLRTKRSQAIQYHGITDAGKTHTMQRVTEHLLALSASHSQRESSIADQIQCAQHILQAFGQAKTAINHQASRHATYWELHFSTHGRLAGGKVLVWGLDKHRLHDLDVNERSYAIFYQLLAGASRKERTEYRLDDVALGSAVPTREDARSFEWTRRAFATLGLKEKHVQGVLRVLSAILHLQSIEFGIWNNQVTVTTPEVLTRSADILQVSASDLQQSLVMDTQYIKNERLTRIMDVDGARRQRDTLIQNMYAVLFSFLVELMNQKLVPRSPSPLHIVQFDPPGFLSRGQLIDGQERPSHFDDLVKNYMADLLRHLHVRSVLDPTEGEVHALSQDGLSVPETHVPSDCMSLLRGGPVPLCFGDDILPVPEHPDQGILSDYAHAFHAVLDGERTEEDDAALFRDLEAHNEHRAFIASRLPNGTYSFDINHALGACSYSVVSHQRSELDLLPTQQLQTLRASRAAFIARLFAGPGLAVESRLTDQQIVLRAQVSSCPLRRATRLGRVRVTWPETRIAGVMQQMDAIVLALFQTMQQADTCWHVFCLRSMDLVKLSVFDKRRVSSQVHALGLPRLVRAKQHGYIRIPLDEFQERFGEVEHVAGMYSWACPADYAVGTSNVYVSYNVWFSLDGHVGPIHAEHAPVPTVHVSPAEAQQSEPTEQYAYRDSMQDRQGMMPLMSTSAALDSETSFLKKDESFMDEPRESNGDVPLLGATTARPATASWQDEAGLRNEMQMSGMDPIELEEEPVTPMRKWWVRLTWAITWWMPDSVLSHVLKKKRPDVRMAWREKVTICVLIFLFCALILFYIIGLGRILCPNFDRAWNEGQLSEHDDGKSFYVAIAGEVYDLTKFYKLDHSDIPSRPVTNDVMMELAGKDLTPYFPVPLNLGCRGLVSDASLELTPNENLTAQIPQAIHKSGSAQTNNNTKLNNQNWYYHTFLPRMKSYHKGAYVYDTKALEEDGSWRNWAVVDETVYDLTNYLNTQQRNPGVDAYSFLPSDIVDLFEAQAGSDITDDFRRVMDKLNGNTRQQTQHCLDQVFRVGQKDFRTEPQCVVQNYLLLSFSILILCSILAKFISALQLAHRPSPEQQDRFVICHIPCYTEGEESLRKTIESITTQEYDDKRKLLFIVCDGMIVGGGNEQPTPRIVLDILGVDRQVDPEPLPFKSVANGSKQLNYGKVYSGLFECEGHVVPFIVVVKVGRPSERSRPGNRGKRDTQIMLMRYLNRVHFDTPMFPLELELYHHMKHVIGIDPFMYEFILMVDADTSIEPDGLNRLVAAAVDDPRTIAVCGETLLDNEGTTFWTMIQVYEYYISHNLAKAFESLFGSVTCLPGCFSMYRLRSSDKGRPLFISDKIIDDYSETKIDTLHKMNLFALGEDRYLTTLLLKHFPLYCTKFRSDAQALTSAPDSFSVLLSQRRRWINSTVHNLVELVRMKGLCGFCLFSMRFIVFIDLVGTIILPATAVYMVYLIVTVATGNGPIPIIAIAMIGAVYGLQAIIFLLKRQWQYIGWMIIYLIAFPIYAFLLPIYSFWHMDDFSWGNTRIVVGEKGNKKVVAGTDDEPYHDSMIPRKTVTEYQQELYANEPLTNEMLLYDMMPPSKSMAHSSFTPNTELDMYADDYFQHTNLLDAKRKRQSNRQSLGSAMWMPTPSYGHESSSMLHSMFAPSLPMYSMTPLGPMYGSGMPPPMFPAPPSDWHTSMMSTGIPGGSVSEQHLSASSLPMDYSENPTDEQIRAQIRTYLATQPSLMQVTKRNVRDAVATSMPNADIQSKKALINQMIDDMLSGQT